MTARILAVDTSCDDTSASVVAGQVVLSNVIASQTQLHKQYGGVFPTVAKQAHKEAIIPTMCAALSRAHIGYDRSLELVENLQRCNIAAIAVTVGPGLAPALEVGINACKDLAQAAALPLIPVNHIEGHVLSVLATTPKKPISQSISFPAVSVIVSGGHTQFVLVKAVGDYSILGATVDDAAGECLDKIGRMLNLGYPAAPVIEQFARRGDEKAITFPLPMTQSPTLEMSFSGLKTFARNYIEAQTAAEGLTAQFTYDFCASAQYSVFRHITYKLSKLLQAHKVAEIWIGGGVAQNTKLRRMIRQTVFAVNGKHTLIRTPYSKRLCMDNAAMIGIVATYKLERGDTANDISLVERMPRLGL